MGRLGAFRAVALALVAFAQLAHASSVVSLNNGVATNQVGHTQISTDEYGSYGNLIGMQYDDEYSPPGVTNPFTPTYMTGAELYITLNGTRYSVLLSEAKAWFNFVENPPPTPDGIGGPLARSITTAISGNATQATSAFRIADTSSLGIQLDFALVQTLAYNTADQTSQLDQVYTITNNGTADVSLVFHLAWDADLFFNTNNSSNDDIVGIGAGLCGPYEHDGDSRWSVALGNGPMSTVPVYGFFAGKQGNVISTGAPAFEPISAPIDKQWLWIDGGMPPEWRNAVAGVGVGVVGESGASVACSEAKCGDATMGLEYRFSFAHGATETIHIIRHYGSTTVACFTSAKCGNGVLDPGELCDTKDTSTCNGATCTASVCGDGYMNTLAGETCDSNGLDTASCNGGSCTAPGCGDGYVNKVTGEACDDGGDSTGCNADCTVASCGDGYANAAAGEACDDGGDSPTCNADCSAASCGDGYINAAADEECEGGELCEPATCKVTFTVGGGCTGCGAGGDGGGALLLGVVALSALRRRRRPRRG